MDSISAVTYTVWMVLVPKTRACSKLHDDKKINFMVFITNDEGKKSILELRADPVFLIISSCSPLLLSNDDFLHISE